MSSSAAAAATAAAAAASPAAATVAEAQARLGELRQQEKAEALAAAALRTAIEALPPGDAAEEKKRRDLAERKEALTAIRAAIEKEEARVDAARGMLDLRTGVDVPDAAVERAHRSLYTFYAGEDQALPSGTAMPLRHSPWRAGSW